MRLHRYHTDPSGTFVRYDAKAIGSGSDAAQQSLQDTFHKASLRTSPTHAVCRSGPRLTIIEQQMTLKEAHALALQVLKQVMEEKLDENNVQLAQVTKEKGFQILGEQELKELIEGMTA